MIECHPLLRPIVHLAQPVVHAVRNWHPRIHHHVHRLFAAATPPQAVMTVCQRVAGPVLAGGLVLLPPASAVPPAGGVGGFPGAIVPEYGAPAFGPGFAGGSSPGAYGPGGGYGPAALGLGGIAPAILASNSPGTSSSPGTAIPVMIAQVTPSVAMMTPSGAPTIVNGPSQPGLSTPLINNNGPPDSNGQPPRTVPPIATPPGVSGSPPGNGGPPGTGGSPGTDTPINTPEPASIAVLATALAVVVFSRALWTRRMRRN